VVTEGVALTLAPVEELNVDEGDQLYVVAPEAVNATGEPPAHIFVDAGLILTEGNGFTVTVACPIPGHPLPLLALTV